MVGDVFVNGTQRGHIGDRGRPDGLSAAILPLPCPRIVLFPVAEYRAFSGIARCDFAVLVTPILGCHAEMPAIIIDAAVTAVHDIIAETGDGAPVWLGEGEGRAGVVGNFDCLGSFICHNADVVFVYQILIWTAAIGATVEL